MGFLTIFYKYIIQQYFTVTVLSQYLKQIKYKMLVNYLNECIVALCYRYFENRLHSKLQIDQYQMVRSLAVST